AIPLMLQYKIPTGGFRPYVLVGPQVDLNISSGGFPSSNWKTFDILAVVGVGFEYKMGSDVIFGANARYALGLLNQNGTTNPANDFEYRNIYILGAIGYIF